MGAIGSGTGILLAVTIIYQYFELFAYVLLCTLILFVTHSLERNLSNLEQ
jgi:preprotein translocase subunit SecY